MAPAQNIYARLGIKTVINGQGTYTTLGGSLMPPEVLQAMAEAAGAFVSIPELQEKVGARIASLIGVPAAMVTSGAASAITVATAACMVHDHLGAIERLPDTEGLQNEVIIQKAHHCGYEPQITIAGAKLVWVETRAELDRAISPQTAMMFFLNRYEPLGQIKRDEWIRFGKEHAVPLFNDAAADVPPAGRLSEYVRQGFDLVAFSGGKALRGPQSAGLLVGRADLVAAGQRAISPHMGMGRGMKVGKEEIVGMLVAIERFVGLDHAAQWRVWETRVAEMIEVLAKVPGMTARADVPEIANHSPHLVVEWSQWHSELKAADAVHRLREGDPSIAVLGEGERGLRVAVWTLRDDEHKLVARRIQQLFPDRRS
jgi:D-glucosaminate-6-phosphate ammonia-lyase